MCWGRRRSVGLLTLFKVLAGFLTGSRAARTVVVAVVVPAAGEARSVHGRRAPALGRGQGRGRGLLAEVLAILARS